MHIGELAVEVVAHDVVGGALHDGPAGVEATEMIAELDPPPLFVGPLGIGGHQGQLGAARERLAHPHPGPQAEIGIGRTQHDGQRQHDQPLEPNPHAAI